MNTKLFLLLFSSFLLEATAAGFNHHRGTNRRQELRRPQANAQELDRSRRYHEPRSDNLDSEARLAAQDFGVSSEDACPAVASMPDCGVNHPLPPPPLSLLIISVIGKQFYTHFFEPNPP